MRHSQVLSDLCTIIVEGGCVRSDLYDFQWTNCPEHEHFDMHPSRSLENSALNFTFPVHQNMHMVSRHCWTLSYHFEEFIFISSSHCHNLRHVAILVASSVDKGLLLQFHKTSTKRGSTDSQFNFSYPTFHGRSIGNWKCKYYVSGSLCICVLYAYVSGSGCKFHFC